MEYSSITPSTLTASYFLKSVATPSRLDTCQPTAHQRCTEYVISALRPTGVIGRRLRAMQTLVLSEVFSDEYFISRIHDDDRREL